MLAKRRPSWIFHCHTFTTTGIARDFMRFQPEHKRESSLKKIKLSAFFFHLYANAPGLIIIIHGSQIFFKFIGLLIMFFSSNSSFVLVWLRPSADRPSGKWSESPGLRLINRLRPERNNSQILVPRATLRGVAELHVASGRPQWRIFVTSCYF